MNEEKPALDEYEEWIESELEKGNFVPVENLEKWKEVLKEAAARTLEKKKRIRLTVELPSPELRDEVIRVLRNRFGKDLKIVK